MVDELADRSPTLPGRSQKRLRSGIRRGDRQVNDEGPTVPRLMQITSISTSSAPAALAAPTQPSLVSAVGLTHSTITSGPRCSNRSRSKSAVNSSEYRRHW
jgi:hypothetical protein